MSTTPLTCAIIDDEPLALGLIESYVRKTPSLSLQGTYSSAVSALQILPNKPVDLLFLDIQMPELNGLEFARLLPPSTKIVFTTAFSEYALDGYKVEAIDYLLKPISYADFLGAVHKAMRQCSPSLSTPFPSAEVSDTVTAEEESIFVKSDYKLVRIRLEQILYVESVRDYVHIYLEETDKPVVSMMSLKTLEEKLPAQRFIRVHRSYIVQSSKIKVIERNRIVFGKTYIPISDSYKQDFQTFLSKYTL